MSFCEFCKLFQKKFFAVNRLLEDVKYVTMMFTQYIPTFRVPFRRGDINLLKVLYQTMIIIIVIFTHLSLLWLGNI